MAASFGRFLRRNTIALLALFIALSGTTFAAANVVLPKNSVGTKQLKNNAVTSAKIKNNQVTGADVKESSLGKVPSAANADHATTAGTASPTGAAGGALAGSYPNPGIAAGAVVPATFGTIPAARLYRTTNQTLASSTYGIIGFDAEAYDNSNMHDNVTNNTRLVAPIGGVYDIDAGLDYNSGPGFRYTDIQMNGATTLSQSWIDATSGGLTEVDLPTQAVLHAGDYVELRAYQNSGGNLDVLGGFINTVHLEMHWVSPVPAGAGPTAQSSSARPAPSR